MSRTKDTENFPVGSWLVAKELRPIVHAYYRFARTADDIGDDPAMPAAEKIHRLDEMDAQLQGGPGEGPATIIRDRLAGTAVPIDHCRNLLVAFKRDAITPRTADWADLMHYCRHSAAPVGRFLLDLHGESRDTWEASDALCAALQILNHLQDCRDDYLIMDRVYLPLDYFTQYSATIEDLRPPKASLGLRQVIDHTIASTRPLVREAGALPGQIRNPGLRKETAIIVAIAERLLEKLATRDPLAERVELCKPELVMAAATGLWRSFL